MNTIPYVKPRRIHSMNVQCELYRKAVMRGLKPVVEYKYENCRFDVVMTANDVIFAIVEIKNYSRANYVPKLTKQMDKYTKIGLPVFLCRNFRDIDYIVTECAKLQKEYFESIANHDPFLGG